MTQCLEIDPVSLEADCCRKTIGVRSQTPIDPDSPRDVTVFMTTDAVDADNEVVLPGGADFSRWEKNPVVLLNHSMGQPGTYGLPVGKGVGPTRRPRGIMVGLVFARNTEMGREVKALWDEEILNAVSIGFKSLESSLMTREEAYSRPDWQEAYERTKGRILVHRKWLLLEVSVVSVPANQDALRVKYKSLGRPVPAWLQLPTPGTSTMPEATEAAVPGGAIETKTVEAPEVDATSTTDQAAEKSHECPDGQCDGKCKDMEDGDMDTMAMKPGDHVTCKGAGCGEVKSVHDSGEHGGMTATKADPVAMVGEHDKSCMPTGKVKAYPMGDLTPHGAAKSMDKAKPPTGSGRVDPDDDGDDDTVDTADTEQDDDDIEEDDLDDGDNDDEVKGFRRHEHVKIKAPHYKGVGVIQSMHKAGHVPDVDEDIKATKDNPAARVQCYKAYGDGHLPTEHHVGVEVKHLTHLPEELKAPSRKSLAAALPTKPRAATKAARPQPAPAPALPPLTGKTPEAKLQEAVASLAKALSPANIQKLTADLTKQEVNRRLGKLSD